MNNPGRGASTFLGQGAIFWCLISLIITISFLSPVLFNQWTNWDDTAYVLGNTTIINLGWGNFFQLFDVHFRVLDTYTPLTLVSFAIEYKIAGVHPALYHFDNLLLHLANSTLVFLLCRFLIKGIKIPFFISLFFGLHPMHVESVAWISERKDVLFAFFYLLATLTYLYKIEVKSKNVTSLYFNAPQLYWLSLFFFLLSIMSKPQAVTLPILLLLLDWWLNRKDTTKLLIEKVPYFLISVIFGIIALNYQQTYDFEVGMIDRAILSAHALTIYFGKFFIPTNLSALYPFPAHVFDQLSAYSYVSIFLLLGSITYAALKKNKSRTLVFGLLFFLIHLIPTLHLIKVNSSLIYDRFTYLPYIGLSWSFIVGLDLLLTSYSRHSERYFLALLTVATLLLGSKSFTRAQIWKNSETLWTNVIDQYPNDYLAYGNRANYYQAKNEWQKALEDYNQCLQLNSNFALGFSNRGVVFQALQRHAQAIEDFTRAIHLDSNDLSFKLNRSFSYMEQNSYELAFSDLETILSKDPKITQAYENRGVIFKRLERYDLAINDYSKAISLAPNKINIYFNRGYVYLQQGKGTLASLDFTNYLAHHQNNPVAFFHRAQASELNQQWQAMKNDLQKARELGYVLPSKYEDLLKRVSPKTQ